jgi:hypothetical protein
MKIEENLIQKIYSLYEECLNRTEPFHTKIDICIVPDELAQMVFEATTIDVSNHWITIDNYGIDHALTQHGNPKSEAKRGQIAVEKEDFIRFIDVVLQPDKILLLENSKRSNLTQIQFEKVIQNKKIVVKEVRTITSKKKNKVSRLIFQTMYKLKSPTKEI